MRTAVVAVLFSFCIGFATPAQSRPITVRNAPGTPNGPAAAAGVGIGTATASLDASSAAIASGDPFGFTARVRAASPIEYLQVRLRIYHPSGRLVFQRTMIEHDVLAGERAFHFERETADLGLRAGVYPTELQVTLQDDAGRSEEVISAGLLVYNPDRTPVDTVMVARVSAQPLTQPDGRFTSDPAKNRAALDEVDLLLRAVAENRRLRVTLAIPPHLLEEWRRISIGYEYVVNGEVIEEAPDAAGPQAYGAVLGRLTELMDRGRIELLSMGYSDPELTSLVSYDMLGDVTDQYQQGLSAWFASLESTASTGTAPAGRCVPPSAAELLTAEDIGYAVVGQDCVRSDEATVSTGVYRASGSSLVVMVGDARAEQASTEGDGALVLERAFLRRLAEEPAGPFVLTTEIGPSAPTSADEFIKSAELLAEQEWLRPVLGRDAAHAEGPQVRLIDAQPNSSAPAGYWSDVLEGRQWANGLTSAGGAALRDAMTARSASLIAQSSAWSHAEWAHAERGRSFADEAERLGKKRLEPIRLSVEAVTLAGTKGSVPVTVSNGTDVPLTVVIAATPSNHLKLVGEHSWTLELRPQENFFEVPVDLQNALAGQLTLAVTAGDLVLQEQTVTVQASYLDRLAIIGGIVLVLGGMLAFIIRRVRAAEAADEAAEQYTVVDDRSSRGGDA